MGSGLKSKIRREILSISADWRLSHTQFDSNGEAEPEPDVYWIAPNCLVLATGEFLRVHTGQESAGLDIEDDNGTDQHAYAEHGNFKLNNAEGDKLYLSLVTPDSAHYDPHVCEGAILNRVGDKLVDLEIGGKGTGTSDSGKVWSAPPVVGDSRKAA